MIISRMKMKSKLIFFIYGLFWDLFYLVAGFLSLVSVKAKRYVRNPFQISEHIKHLEEVRRCNSKRVYIYCSSAGEYEQALPVATRLIDQGWFIQFGFFSFSGSYYAHKRKEKHSYFQHLTDHPRYWRKVFSAYQPQITLVVRHEIWPAFVREASSRGFLALMDLSKPKDTSEDRSFLRQCGIDFQVSMMKKFSKLYCVDQKDLGYFSTELDVKKLMAVGDTKFDRVSERASPRSASAETVMKNEAVMAWIDEVEIGLESKSSPKELLVVGSAWPEDLDLILRGIALCRDFWLHYRVLVVPHDITAASVRKFIEQLMSLGVTADVFQSLGNFDKPRQDSRGSSPQSVKLLNAMGILAECYRIADRVWVGGAVAGKIHNVLEPAVFMKKIAHGPNYFNQAEAVLLVENELSTVVDTPEAFQQWIMAAGVSGVQVSKQEQMQLFIAKNLGASQRIVEDILAVVTPVDLT